MVASVGRSSYGDLNGIEQFVATQDIADQVSSLAYEFDTQYPGAQEAGDRLTVNEGIRSRDRQTLLYRQYLDGGVLAAYPFTSTHDATRGSALDFGITMRDGRNRALTQPEFDWMHEHGPARGIEWTGRYFARVEQWHHNGGYAATVPPIVGVNRPGEPFYSNENLAPPDEEDDDMKIELIRYANKPEVYAYCPGTPLWMHVTQAQVDSIRARFSTDVRVVPTGAEFNLMRDLAGNLRQQSARDVWAYQLEDKTAKKTRTAGQFFQLVADYLRKAAK